MLSAPNCTASNDHSWEQLPFCCSHGSISRYLFSALQRWGHSPNVIRVKRLNALTKWIQAKPRRLVYKPFVSPGDWQVEAGTHLRAYSDSAFKQEEQTGHCMRGAVFLLCPGKHDESFVRTAKCHLLDFVSRQQRTVVRATFSQELR